MQVGCLHWPRCGGKVPLGRGMGVPHLPQVCGLGGGGADATQPFSVWGCRALPDFHSRPRRTAAARERRL